MRLSLPSALRKIFYAPTVTPSRPSSVAQLGSVNSVLWSEFNIFGVVPFEKWNPDDLISRKGFAIYRKMMMDEQVKAVVKFKRGAITSRKWYFDLTDEAKDKLSETDQKFRVSLMKHIVNSMGGNFRDGLNAILAAQWQGFSITEKIPTLVEYEGKTYFGLGALRPKPFDTFHFVVDEASNVQRLVQRVNTKEQSVPLDRVVHFVVNPEYDDQYGGSELREAYRSWFCKDSIIKLESIFLERAASGFNVVEQDGEATAGGTRQYSDLLTALGSIAQMSSVVLPPGMKLTNFPSRDTQAFNRALVYHDQAIAKSLLMPNLLGLSQTGQTGSYSQSQTQFEAFLWTLDDEATRLVDCCNEQIFRQIGEANFGDPYWPRFCLEPLSSAQKVAVLTMWGDLVSKRAVQATDTDEAHVRELMDFPEAGEPIVDATAMAQTEALAQRQKQNPSGSGAEQDEPAQTQDYSRARTRERVTTFSAARRVAFSVIERKMDAADAEAVDALERSLASATARMAGLLGDGLQQADLRAVDMTSGEKRSVQSAVHDGLKASWKIGQRHASDEVGSFARKKRGASPARASRIEMARIDELAVNYFKEKSFTVAGKTSGALTETVRRNIERGLKYSWTPAETTRKIYQELYRGGMLKRRTVREAIGLGDDELDEAIGERVAEAHRLMTTVRTVNAEAVNEARYSLFTDPDLADLVTGFEYSSVMDSRTTAVCREMNGKTFSSDSEVWDEYRPPLHFNCRSILVPLTSEDWDGDESSRPRNKPQEGF